MKTKEDILKALEQIEKSYPNVEDVPEYVRGQYSILKWILEEDKNNE